MAERFGRPQTLSSDNIADIVRRVVGAFGNLPSNPSNESGSASSIGSGAGPSYVDTQHELHDRFRIPRASTASSSSGPGRALPRARSSGRFVPYTRGKGNGKGKSEQEVVIKDACLLPDPEWTNVPRRDVKETLVRQNLYIDAWSMDKSWSEEMLRREIRVLFEDRLEGGNR